MKTAGPLCALFVMFCSAVVLAQPGAANSNQIYEDDLRSPRNWAVDFSPLTGGVREVGKLVVVENAVPSAASHFITVVPCRILDTRDPNGPFGGPIMSVGSTRSYNVPAGPCPGIPSTASAYSLSFSVTQTAASGFLTAWPAGATQPNAATITWFGGSQTLSSSAIVPAGTSSSISVFAGQTTHVIIDINGYFVEGVVTNLTAGTGLTGGGTGSVSMGIADGGVGTTQLADGAVTDVKLGTITAPGKVANSATTATSANTANAIVSRDVGGNFSAGTVALSGNLILPTSTSTAGNLLKGGARLLHTFGSNNVFLGINAGNFTMIGSSNTAIGFQALNLNNQGNFNTASGRSALVSNSNGHQNTASGYGALFSNSTGHQNTASGRSALASNTTGDGNIAVGDWAGLNLTTGNNNIAIGNPGVASESNTIRIGRLVSDPILGAGVHTRAFLAGVLGVKFADGTAVQIDANGQLGTTSSSATVKRDIAGMGDQSSPLMKLRPVSFFYRNDTVGIRQYGLIAEEVAEVMPELVQFSAAGQAETVRYHFLAPLLLSEIQKQQQTIGAQRETIEEQRRTNEQQRRQLTIIEARLAALEE